MERINKTNKNIKHHWLNILFIKDTVEAVYFPELSPDILCFLWIVDSILVELTALVWQSVDPGYPVLSRRDIPGDKG